MAHVFRAQVLVCGGSECTASGSHQVREALRMEIARRGLSDEVRVITTGCRGLCSSGPTMFIYPEGLLYCRVTVDDIPEIVEETLVKGRVVERLTYHEPATHQALPHYDDIPFYHGQTRVALRNCGNIDPDNIDEYIAVDGYQALARVLTQMSPEDVIDEIKRSGLRGRGGAGFPTGLKWQLARDVPGERKYVICNAEEGDPGAYMDRSILESDPHSIIEAMLIAAYAVGATEGYVYCRAEYELAALRLRHALAECYEYGLMGQDILGSGFSFDLQVREVPGIYVCGEETALIESIQGQRGEPRPRPPMPTAAGLWDCPTVVNNVETLANIPVIISRGASWFASYGTESCKGTKVFAISGKVNSPGLIEVPWGATLRQLIFEMAGGILNGKAFKAVQVGGPLGGFLPAQYLDVPIEFGAFTDAGATIGHGGIVVLDEDDCMVELCRYFLTFAREECCGKCIPCRVGGERMLQILTGIAEGRGMMDDLDALVNLAEQMEDASLCALGQSAPVPVLSALRYFPEDFHTHILDHTCPTGACYAAAAF